MRWVLGELQAQSPNLFLWAPVLFGGGIALYFGLNGPPTGVFLVLWGVGFIAACLFALQRRSTVLRQLGLGLIWFILGYLNASLRAALVAAPVLGWNYYGPVEGRIIGLDRSASNAPRMVLDQITLPGARDTAVPARIRLSAVGEIAPDILRPGARITTTAFLSPPEPPVEPGGFDFRRFAWFNQLGAIGYSRNPVLAAWPGAAQNGLSVWLLSQRMALADWVRAGIPGVDGAFAAAIVSGDRSAIDPAVLNDLRASNLAHLLAISGLHMGLLSGFVFMLLRRGMALVPGLALAHSIKKYAAFGALLAAAGYLLLSGANVATQRAFIMAAVVLVAVMLDRPALTLRSVALAALIVLIIAPESLMEAGFQMSFSATTGLIAAYSALRGRWVFAPGAARWQRILGWSLGVVLTSAVGGAATAPFSAFNFNTISQFGLLANVLAVPMMGLVVMPAAVVALLLSPFGLSGAALAVMGWGIAWILGVASYVAALPGAVIPVVAAPWQVLGLISLGGLILCLLRGWLRLAGLVPAALALLVWSSATRPALLIDGDGRLMGVMGATGRALNKDRAYSYAAQSWLQNDGDSAAQDAAFARDGLQVYTGGSAAVLDNGWEIILHWGRDIPQQPCTAKRLFVFSGQPQPRMGPCLWVSPDDFARMGALAITPTGEGLEIVTTLSDAQTHYWQR
ncbi:ComEC family competence protein [Abyssibius alkaniclasticus]|uniref:ComEC/Rec2 family competence protein n=1 Tax=Abyssibius alkaniclasticus TaxID=2881234 RepID=UPI002364246D|nr:ComEC/Rec2 family competence protein [Abyssibius alkaniclasticus]UPH70698.1 ComEC family competence protein [Abyssibius alkaniclasticus]